MTLLRRGLRLPIAGTAIQFDLWWLPVLPVAAWALATQGIPLFAPALSPTEMWAAAILSLLCMVIALPAHAAAHILVARRIDAPLPEAIPIYPFGEPAQLWPQPRDPWHAMLVAIAGPITHLLLALIAFLVWDRQFGPLINTIAVLQMLLNGALALAGLTPGYPFDGGRLILAVSWEMGFPARGALIARRLGWLVAGALLVWGAVLIALQARFSLPTGAATIAAALAIMALLRRHPPPQPAIVRSRAGSAAAWTATSVMALLQVLGPLTMLPMVDGIYAPGVAVEVEPMIIVPPERLQQHAGAFLLTTVVSQTPITFGQWFFARFNPAFEIVAPERVVPRDVAPQELVRQSFAMLEESEALAVVAAMRLAGYEATIISTAVEVQSVLPESPNAAVLQPGDLIYAIGGMPTPSVDALGAALAQRTAGDRLPVEIERGVERRTVEVTLMPPAEAGVAPRIGIGVRSFGLDLELPFPVSISPQKIVGGPSAGLMFTLTIYNMITPDDLTGGRRIAGTGTIDIDGRVGPIGGVAQKVAGAEAAGAQYFIVPIENYADAQRAARTITLIPVASAQEAIEKLRALEE
jgi:PDZ domain-containing protein